MESIIVLVACLALLMLAYRYYSPLVARWLGVEPDRPTPSHTMADGVDYCPAKAPVLFGHHFASIAGAAPIVGPIIAAVYGWLPVLLWVMLGGIFVGAVHDMSALIASIRHGGRSIGEVIDKQVGRTGKLLFLFFLWSALVLLIAVYMDVVAKTFASVPSAGSASSLFVALAVLFGLAIYRFKLPLGWVTLVSILILAICIAAGWRWPLELSTRTWMIMLIVYISVATVAPVWLLLQPRDYLNSFLLYALLVITIIGIFAAHPGVQFPAFITWTDPQLGFIFPILFVTVACGAISGYHSVVASGTTAKQLDRESHARPIGYGGMLVESLVSVLVIIVVMMLSKSEFGAALSQGGPVTLFSRGVGTLLSSFHIDPFHGTTFAALVISAFVLTTLDTATRLCRFAFQEFFAPAKGGTPTLLSKNRYVATAVTVGAASALAFSGEWKQIWPIFGSANQLLAALALLAVSLWLRHLGRKYLFLVLPMIAMFLITVSAFSVIIYENIERANFPMAAIAAALFLLSLVLIVASVNSVRRAPAPQK